MFLFVLLTVISVSSVAQIRHTERGFFLHTGFVVLPRVAGNGALDNTAASIMLGFGGKFKVDGTSIEGSLAYIPAKKELFTVGGRLMFELPIRQGGINFPFSIGLNYRMFVSNWELHCVGLSARYDSKSWFVEPEFGVATRTLRAGRPAAGYALIALGYKLDWRF